MESAIRKIMIAKRVNLARLEKASSLRILLFSVLIVGLGRLVIFIIK